MTEPQPQRPLPQCALAWVADSDDGSYVREAAQNAASFAQKMPAFPRFLFTRPEHASTMGIFTAAYPMPRRRYQTWYLNNVWYYNLALEELTRQGYERVIFLDTDAYCAEDGSALFELAERFDIAAAHGLLRESCPTVGYVPLSFPEFEIGVLLVAINDRAKALFRRWLELYSAHEQEYGNNDQGPLREAMWLSPEVRVYATTPEWECRWGFGCFVSGWVRFLHCRGRAQNEVADIINGIGGVRLFRPYQVVYGNKML